MTLPGAAFDPRVPAEWNVSSKLAQALQIARASAAPAPAAPAAAPPPRAAPAAAAQAAPPPPQAAAPPRAAAPPPALARLAERLRASDWSGVADALVGAAAHLGVTAARPQLFVCAAVCTHLQASPELCANAKVAEAFLQQHLGGVADPLRKMLLKTISLANERDKAELLKGLAEKAEADSRAERDVLLKEVEALIRSAAAAPPAPAPPQAAAPHARRTARPLAFTPPAAPPPLPATRTRKPVGLRAMYDEEEEEAEEAQLAAKSARAAAAAAAAALAGEELGWVDAHCTACRLSEVTEFTGDMVLCDRVYPDGPCKRGLHLLCAQPPLAGPPEGAWFCAPCERERQEGVPEVQLASLNVAQLRDLLSRFSGAPARSLNRAWLLRRLATGERAAAAAAAAAAAGGKRPRGRPRGEAAAREREGPRRMRGVDEGDAGWEGAAEAEESEEAEEEELEASPSASETAETSESAPQSEHTEPMDEGGESSDSEEAPPPKKARGPPAAPAPPLHALPTEDAQAVIANVARRMGVPPPPPPAAAEAAEPLAEPAAKRSSARIGIALPSGVPKPAKTKTKAKAAKQAGPRRSSRLN